MKTIIAGSRSIRGMWQLKEALAQFHEAHPDAPEITEIVCGGATGPDTLGRLWAEENGIPVKMMVPDWSKGRHAGFARNGQMANYGDALIALWDGKSNGTANMIDLAKRKKLRVWVCTI